MESGLNREKIIAPNSAIKFGCNLDNNPEVLEDSNGEIRVVIQKSGTDTKKTFEAIKVGSRIRIPPSMLEDKETPIESRKVDFIPTNKIELFKNFFRNFSCFSSK